VQEPPRLMQVGQQGHGSAQAANQRNGQRQVGNTLPLRLAPYQTGQGQQKSAVGNSDQEKILDRPWQPRRFARDIDGFDDLRIHVILQSQTAACRGFHSAASPTTLPWNDSSSPM